MKKVRYVFKEEILYSSLTIDMVYDVVKVSLNDFIRDRDVITLMVNGVDKEYYMYYEGVALFEDATAEYRCEIINEILN